MVKIVTGLLNGLKITTERGLSAEEYVCTKLCTVIYIYCKLYRGQKVEFLSRVFKKISCFSTFLVEDRAKCPTMYKI